MGWWRKKSAGVASLRGQGTPALSRPPPQCASKELVGKLSGCKSKKTRQKSFLPQLQRTTKHACRREGRQPFRNFCWRRAVKALQVGPRNFCCRKRSGPP